VVCDRWKWRRLYLTRLAMISGEFVTYSRCSIPKRAITDFQGGAGRWTSKSDHRWRTCVVTSLNRNQVVDYWSWFVVRLRSLYVKERSLYLMRSSILSQCRDIRTGVMWKDFGILVTAQIREFWMFWSLFIWDCGSTSVQWVAVVKFRMNDGSGDGTGSFEVKIVIQEDICWRESWSWMMLESKTDGWKKKKSCVSSA